MYILVGFVENACMFVLLMFRVVSDKLTRAGIIDLIKIINHEWG